MRLQNLALATIGLFAVVGSAGRETGAEFLGCNEQDVLEMIAREGRRVQSKFEEVI